MNNKISNKLEALYLELKPLVQEELKTQVICATYSTVENPNLEESYFEIITPNCGGNYLLVPVNYGDTAEDVLKRYYQLSKKEDLIISLAFKNPEKYA